jgi:DNA-binding transcriptional regulator/RsmH inhibitor MraZ
LQAAQANIAVSTTQAEKNRADATLTAVEAQMKPQEVQAKVQSALTNNLPNQADQASAEFDKRVKIAELMLKEADIKNKSKIVELQMSNQKENLSKVESDFLDQLAGSLKQ